MRTKDQNTYLGYINFWFLMMLLIHVPVYIVSAHYTDIGVYSTLIAALAIMIAPVVSYSIAPNARITSMALGISAMCMSALLIHIFHGMIEMHFHVFVMLALMIAFGSPWVLLVSSGVLLVQHIIFFFYFPASVFNYEANFPIVLLHAFFVLCQVIPSCFIVSKYWNLVRQVASDLSRTTNIITQEIASMIAVSEKTSAASEHNERTLLKTSSGLEEMSSMVSVTSEHLERAAHLATEAKTTAQQGSSAMNELEVAVNEIRIAAEKTGKIVKTIDNIAFQTNLLALNAAVEAARAGEAGRGFAVVAREIRALAQSASEASKNTAILIETSLSLSLNGVKLSKNALDTITKLSISNTGVNELVASISVAIKEQSSGISMLMQAMREFEEVRIDSAQIQGESVKTSKRLTNGAENLGRLVTLIQESTGVEVVAH